ncbi:MAG: hypothetical protein KME14_18355 [Tildeniella torsiva UHER 1998/13D]|jgi:hypothetical protein|nr:hypothetical protein [Tildeniella torsiva UHER 1998/13D]
MADPTVGDVFNQLVFVNGKLDQIDTNTFGLANAVSTLDSNVNLGFQNTADMLKILAQLDIEAIKLLFHLTQQNETIICALEKISNNTCETLAQVTTQTQLQKQMLDSTNVLRDIAESAYPSAALERKRLAELHAEVERCCPPEQPKPACSYQPCPKPRPIEKPELPEIPKNDDGHQPPIG